MTDFLAKGLNEAHLYKPVNTIEESWTDNFFLFLWQWLQFVIHFLLCHVDWTTWNNIKHPQRMKKNVFFYFQVVTKLLAVLPLILSVKNFHKSVKQCKSKYQEWIYDFTELASKLTKRVNKRITFWHYELCIIHTLSSLTQENMQRGSDTPLSV